MFKNLLVNIPSEHSPRSVIDGAISLAARYQAQLDALSAGHEIANMPFLAEGGAAVATISKVEHAKALARAQAALAIFEAEAKRAGISYTCRAISELQAEAAAILGATARLYDLTVVAQPEFERNSFDNTLAQEILFQSGGPVLFIPYIFRGAFQGSRVGICWDGSRLAARAVRDAMPLLEQAEAITILTINPASTVPADASAAHLMSHLSRLGARTKIADLTTNNTSIQSSILSLAADENLDLLVMGGYGHSRLRETVFGGVTREMLETMTIPTLMSH
jgi:nucleotide-binding universal stress UspA family protein